MSNCERIDVCPSAIPKDEERKEDWKFDFTFGFRLHFHAGKRYISLLKVFVYWTKLVMLIPKCFLIDNKKFPAEKINSSVI